MSGAGALWLVITGLHFWALRIPATCVWFFIWDIHVKGSQFNSPARLEPVQYLMGSLTALSSKEYPEALWSVSMVF
jgi:hypothetical protein